MESSDLATCTACPRLAAFVAEARAQHPDWHAAPVPPWGPADAAVVCVGLAPGYRGANRTGRPFSGDQSGSWVYGALHAMGWARSADPLEAGGALCGARITNAVKCVPPQNKPTPAEQRTCRERWLRAELVDGPARVFVAFGAVAHDALLGLAGVSRSAHPFTHGAEHRFELGGRPRVLLDSFHPSPLNTQTGRMTRDQFHAVFARAKALVDAAAAGGA
jgi:uracil-DNA glycosylase family 4